ncbi:MAG: penicillin-binding protein 2 [Patescibacteria group bacterium]|nr:penicillin-binding protein 2 [Patescibacteria group bacterium]
MNWRTTVVFFLLFSLSILVIRQLYLIQIKKGEYWSALALGQQVLFEEQKGERGEIFLENGNLPLAQTKRKIIVYLSGEKIIDKDVETLANILGEEKKELVFALKNQKILKREISEDVLKNLKEKELQGVSFDEILARTYPQKNFSSHVLGFVNQEGKGQYGIEGYFDKVLRGQEDFKEQGKSPFGYLILLGGSFGGEAFSKGADLYLTLDYNIQYFSEKLLKEAKEKWDIDSGQIIVTIPESGKILAQANFPSFDPNQYFKENFELFLNPAWQTLFEPGSIFKPITMAAALQEELVTPQTKYEDKGYVEIKGKPIHNYGKRAWGEVSMTDVLEESINTGAVFLQQKLGKEKFLEYLEKFGFFEKTGIDSQEEIFSLNETLKKGHPRDLATASFGQGVAITPIQLVRAFGAIANAGKLMKPYLIEKIIKSNGQNSETQSQTQREVISTTTAFHLTSMLTKVVEQGSARRAKIEGYFIAGKTGTAQVPLKSGGYSEEETIHSFIGYFPAFAPKVLIFIKLDNPKGVKEAGYSAVPLFRELAKHIIDLWQIPPDYE